MATVALDAQAQKELADLMVELSNDKEYRPVVNKFLKKRGGKVLPDVELNDMREELRREREADKLEREREKALAKLEAQKDMLKSRYDDASITEIEKLMEKLGISDYATGARIYAAETKAATPTSDMGDHTWTLPKIKVEDFGTIKQKQNASLRQAIDDLQRKRA